MLSKITPINNLCRKEQRLVSIAVENAYKSMFDSSKRLGAVLVKNPSCILCWHKSTS